MLILLLLLIVFGAYGTSIPLSTQPNPAPDPLTLFGRAVSAPDCLSASDQRTARDILWSCISVMFSCTWVAVHPNIPSPKESGFSRVWRRIGIMFYALLAPEVMTTWALRQRRAARSIVREYNETHCREEYERLLKRPTWVKVAQVIKHWLLGPDENAPQVWTLWHGFFIQMGGLMLLGADGKPERVLTFDDMMERINQGEIDPPTLSDAEIRDKGKSDILIKLIVVLQTTWFAARCGARWAQHLSVTELEVITLAFAVLNIATYALWWNKPQDVQIAIPIRRTYIVRSESPDNMSFNEGPSPHPRFTAEPLAKDVEPPHLPNTGTFASIPERDKGCQRENSPHHKPTWLLSTTRSLPEAQDAESPHTPHTPHIDTFARVLERGKSRQQRGVAHRKSTWIASTSHSLLKGSESRGKCRWASVAFFIISTPMLLFVGCLRPLWKINPCIHPRVSPVLLRVPMFYADRKGKGLWDNLLPFIANGVILVFSALHLVLWSSSFPTRIECYLWRICALSITILPGISTFTIFIDFSPVPHDASLFQRRKAKRKRLFLAVYLLVATSVYIVSRFILIVLALSSVRDLPTEAYETVQWTHFFPRA